MNQLKLYRYNDFYLDLFKRDFVGMYEKVKDKVYTCLGEFEHAPHHCIMVEFGTWEFLSGMQDFCMFDELDSHPDDFSINLDERLDFDLDDVLDFDPDENP